MYYRKIQGKCENSRRKNLSFERIRQSDASRKYAGTELNYNSGALPDVATAAQTAVLER